MRSRLGIVRPARKFNYFLNIANVNGVEYFQKLSIINTAMRANIETGGICEMFSDFFK